MTGSLSGRDAVILGAGTAGLVAASILLRQGCRNILVLDEYDRPGGNHIDVRIGDCSFDIGAIVFHAASPFFAHFPAARASCIPHPCSVSKINPRHAICAYPFAPAEDLLRLGGTEILRTLASALAGRLRRGEIATTRDYAVHWMGRRFFERSGLAHYIERFHGLPAHRLDRSFAEKRMQWIARSASLRGLAKRALGATAPAPADIALVRPAEGFAVFYAAVQAQLEGAGVTFRLGARLDRIARRGPRFEVAAGGRSDMADRLISTVPLDQALQACGLPVPAALVSLTLVSLFFSFRGERGFASSILYNFSLTGRWKRLTVFSDYYGTRNGRQYFTVEANLPPGSDMAGEEVIASLRDDFLSDVAAKGLFEGDLAFEGAHRLARAYPTYPLGAPAAIASAMRDLQAFGLELAGRQGTFDYLPTAHSVTLAVTRALQPAAAA